MATLAGLVVAAYGGARALWLVAALLALAAVTAAIALTDPARGPGDPGDAGSGHGYMARLRQGATFLRQERLLRAIVGMLIATNLLDQAFIAVLLPVWARTSGYGAEMVGVVVSTFGATSILAALAAAAIGDRLPRRRVYLIGFVVGGVPRFAAMALGMPLGSAERVCGGRPGFRLH